jgi:type II secretory pathway pseudopilin PulG
MSSDSSKNRRRLQIGFTLVEAVAAIAIVGVGVTSAMAGLAAMTKSDRLIREREILQRLAVQKYEELVATGQFETAELSGDFADQYVDDYEWVASVEPSGEENLEIVTVTVTRLGDSEGPQASVDGLLFNPPLEGGAQ